MRHLIKISAITLCALFLFQSAAFAAEVNMQELNEKHLSDFENMDRVYKYDFMEKRAEEVKDNTEHIKDATAASLVLALGLMDTYDDFMFHEENLVTKSEFDAATAKLLKSSQKAGDEGLSYVTHLEAAEKMLSVIGYDVYRQKYNSSRAYVAEVAGKKAKILKDIPYNAEKNMTRGEFARLLYNTVLCDVIEVAVIGAKEEYVTNEGRNLLYMNFDSTLVKGCVTATNGISVFTEKAYESDMLEIDRVPYKTRIATSNDFLGRQAEAVVQKDSADRYYVIGLAPSQTDKTIVINSEDITSFDDDTIQYEGKEGKGKVSLKYVATVCYNGIQEPRNKLSDLIDQGGEIRIVNSEPNGNYDAVAILKYHDYTVAGVSAYDTSIALAHNRLLNGKSHIKLNADDKNFYIERNGDKAEYTSLLPKDILSVIVTPNGFLNIKASGKAVRGKITNVDDQKCIINDVEYSVSEGYRENKLSGTMILDLTVGTEGIFYLNHRDEIVDIAEGDTSNHYAYLRTAYDDSGALSVDLKLRIFTSDGAWKTYPLADTLTLDGVRMSKKDAAAILKRDKDAIFDALIRYRINDNGELNFLDTIRVKAGEEAAKDPELYDEFAISRDTVWTGKHNWTVQSDHIALTNSVYSMNAATIVFSVPDKTENEKNYTVSKPSFAIDSDGTIELYNIDDLFSVPLAIERLGGSSGLKADLRYLVVDRVSVGVNNDGEDVAVLRGHSGYLPPNWFEVKLISAPEDKERVLALKRGDVVHYAESAEELKGFEVTVQAADFATQPFDQIITGDYYISLGEIVKVDVAKNMVKIKLKTSEVCYAMHSLAIFEQSTGKIYNATLGDLHVGDKVFAFGGNQLMRMLIVR